MRQLITEGFLTFEVENYHKDGHVFPMEVSASLITIDGEPVIQSFSRDITDRKIAEKELLKIQSGFNSAQKLAHIGSWEWDLSDNTALWSDETYRIFGINKNDLNEHRKKFLSMIVPEDQAKVDLALNDALNDTKKYDVEYRICVEDGNVKDIHALAEVIRDEAGKPIGMHGTVQDISDRRKIERALQESEERLSNIMNNSPAVIFMKDKAGRYLFVNSHFEKLFNTSNAAMLGITDYNFLPKEVADAVTKADQNVIQSGNLINFEEQIPLNDGIHYYLSHKFPVRNVSNEVYAVCGIAIDITERKIAEQSMRIASTAFETHESIMITDANANIIRVNQAFQDTTGYSAADVLGKNPRILSSGRQDKAFYAAMWKQLLESGTWTGEIWDKRKDGQLYPKWMTITAVKDNADKITEYVAIFSDITARKKAEEEIYSLAYYDSLTKLPNRRHLLDRIHQAQAVSSRSKQYGALLLLDMDRFKTLNDTLGHDHGDLFLIEIAKRLQSSVRDVDTVARIGGDEFVILIEEIGLNAIEVSQKVALIAEKIRVSLSSPYQLKEHEHHSSPSIGVCLYLGIDESVESLFKHADMAMYQAKESGRNAVRLFDPAMQLAVETRANLEADLRHAVPEKQLQLYYQIQLDSDLRPLGAEALIRWIHPVRGMVSPLQFIPVAEESSLILEIGHWVLETACKQLSQWAAHEHTKNLILAVNVSAKQFKKHDFVETLTTLVNIHQVKPEQLKLELTESVVLSDVADVITKMHALKALGIKLSLDDFGTGYSSLSYLKQLPLDQIKIDQSFVRDMTIDPNDAVMVQTIINLAISFRLNVIAEGVETDAQLNLLKQNGCMAYQGYLFSKPVPIAEFEKLLVRNNCQTPSDHAPRNVFLN
jgi:diguanylate cyclase (GGDEF)-like protein/PAS domain S-box-containing protein